MTKSKCKILLLIVLIATLISTISFATVEPTTSEEPTTQVSEENETTQTSDEDSNWVNSDLFVAEDKVEVTGIVDGNAFIFGSEVTISGEIGGDVFVCANKLTISGGYIYSSLFAMANEINVNGIVYDVYAVTNNFTLDTDGYVYRDLKVSANTITLNGSVRRDAYLSAANYNFSAGVGSIGNNLSYSANSEVTIPEGFVTGQTTYSKLHVEELTVSERILSYVLGAVSTLIYTLIVVLLAIWLAPKFVSKVTSMDSKKALTSLGFGVLGTILVVIALLAIVFSTLCSQLFIAGTFMFIVICMSGLAFASIYFGVVFAKLVKWNIQDNKMQFILSVLIATLILWIITKIPFIGGFIGFAITLFGIGTLFFNIIPKKEVVVENTQE